MKQIIYNLIKLYQSHINIIKTIYINFKVLGIKQGLKFPIIIFGKTDLNGFGKGSIIFNTISFGILRIGGGGGFYGRVPFNCTIFHNFGKIIIHGRVNILNGAIINISENGCLEIGKRVSIGSNIRLKCTQKITIDESVMISWDCQIFDTDFHYIISNNEIARNNKSIYIGKNTWIGSRVTILKGVVIPQNTIVAACSLVNKSFDCSSTSIVLGGVPARIIGYDKKRFAFSGEDMQSLIVADEMLNKQFYNSDIDKLKFD